MPIKKTQQNQHETPHKWSQTCAALKFDTIIFDPYVKGILGPFEANLNGMLANNCQGSTTVTMHLCSANAGVVNCSIVTTYYIPLFFHWMIQQLENILANVPNMINKMANHTELALRKEIQKRYFQTVTKSCKLFTKINPTIAF